MVASAIICFSALYGTAQNTWVFGDSCKLIFTNAGYSTGRSSSTGFSTSTINLPNGSFYASGTDKALYYASQLFNSGRIFNSDDSVINKVSGFKVTGWGDQMVLLPCPGDSSKAYLFVSLDGDNNNSNYASLYMTGINLYNNSGSGSVFGFNQALLNADIILEMHALRHGNGRDWWIYLRQANGYAGPPTNLWYRYLLDPTGLHGPYTQNIGQQTNNITIASFTFNHSGDKVIYYDAYGLLDIYSVDRCTGLFFNPMNITSGSVSLTNRLNCIRHAEFSSDDHYLYCTAGYNNMPDTSYLLQFDMSAPNFNSTKTILMTMPETSFGTTWKLWDIKLAPDNKIYISSLKYYDFPYPDTCCYDTTTMYLSVINHPDSAGAACDFQLFSAYLGGCRQNRGLPNIPDYNLGPAIGSGCDTLAAGLPPVPDEPSLFQCFPVPVGEELKLRWGGFAKPEWIAIFNETGQELVRKKWESASQIEAISIQDFQPGVYEVILETKNGTKYFKRIVHVE